MQSNRAAQQIRLQYLKRVACLTYLTVQPELIQRIREVQLTDSTTVTLKKDVEQGVHPEVRVSADGLLRFQDKLYILDDSELKIDIITEAHNSKFAIHLESTKMC